jgi:hypothetical protein
MSHQLSQQHPQVVLRSRYQQLKALLVLAAITVLCLTAAVVILAVNEDGAETAPVAAAPAVTAPVVTSTFTGTPGLRYDGGPEEGSRGPRAVTPPAGTRYDGGPEEGTRGARSEPAPVPGSPADIGRWGPH